jgi:hypothetical protein
MTGNAGTGAPPTGSAGTGGITPIDPGTVAPPSSGWFDALKASDCSAAPTALPASRIWRLSAEQWKNSVVKALGVAAPDVNSFPNDGVDPRTGFSDDSSGNKITGTLAQTYFDASDRVVSQAAPAVVTAFPCLSTAPVAANCAQMVVGSYGQKLFRRALTPAENTQFANYLVAEAKLDPVATAVGSMLKAMMMSPEFLFRTELGTSKPGPVDMTGDEIAAMLSYTIADMPPDDQLTQAAAAGQLADPAQRTAQAQRLAALPSARAKLAQFWNEYLALGDQPTVAGIDQSSWNESTNFFAKIALDGAGTYKDLVTSPFTYADKTLAAVYGTAQPAADGKLTLDPKTRSGFLTSAGMLGKTAAPSQAGTVIHRGLLVRQRMLCQTPPPPPATVVPDPAKIQEGPADATAKENYDLFVMAHKDCNVCHSNFQPLGLAFETYDAMGKYRTTYSGGKPILTSGTLMGAGDASGDYADVPSMAAKIGASQIGQYCFAQQFASFAFGRLIDTTQEACTIKAMGDYVTGRGGQVKELLSSFAGVPTATRRYHQ